MSKWTKEIRGKSFIRNSEFLPVSDIPRDLIASKEVIYEVIRIINGKPLFLDEHFRRLRLSFRLKSINLPFNKNFLAKKIALLIDKEHFDDINIKILFILGEPNIEFLAYFLKSVYPAEKLYYTGVETGFYFKGREDPNIKMIKLSWRKAVEQFILENNLFEAILVNSHGHITEGSRSNFFFIKDNKLFTSPEKNVLPGITRKKIFFLAKKNQIEIIQKEISYQAANKYQAAFLTGTSPKVLPVNRIENVELDVNNDLLKLFIREYDELILPT